jgi:uncharacterized protein (UPF0335 family)
MSNMFDQDEVAAFIQSIEGLEGEIANSKATHMNFARKKRDEIKETFDEAKERGIPRKVLAKILKRRGLEADIDALEKELDEDHKPLFDSLAEVFARYKEPVQQDMFSGQDDDEEEQEEQPFEPAFTPDPQAAHDAEQAEGEAVLNGDQTKH